MQVAVPPAPERVHGFGPNVPFPLLFQSTVPDGVIGVPGDVSVTTAVHGVEWWSVRLLAVQVTLVDVLRGITLKLNVIVMPW